MLYLLNGVWHRTGSLSSSSLPPVAQEGAYGDKNEHPRRRRMSATNLIAKLLGRQKTVERVDTKPRVVKGVFSCATTSTKPAIAVLHETLRVTQLFGITTESEKTWSLRCSSGEPDGNASVRFEIEVVRIPNIDIRYVLLLRSLFIIIILF